MNKNSENDLTQEQVVKAQHILTEKRFSVANDFDFVKQHLLKTLKGLNPKGEVFDKTFEALKKDLEERIERQDLRSVSSVLFERYSDFFTIVYVKSKGVSRIVAKEGFDELASIFVKRTDGELLDFQFKDCYLLCFCQNNLADFNQNQFFT